MWRAAMEAPERLSALAAPLRRFLEANKIEVAWYEAQAAASALMPRFVRLARDEPLHEALAAFEGAKRVDWLPGFVALPGLARLKGHAMYESGRVLGMDAASGFAVRALGASPGERVLDLCCAPGGKLLMLADAMQHRGTLIGVDASPDRARTCGSLCRKYRAGRPGSDGDAWDFRLLVADGVTYSRPADAKEEIWCSEADRALFSAADDPTVRQFGAPRKRLSKRMRRDLDQARKRRRTAETAESAGEDLFDRVLVDAECTHDGSLRHMAKFAEGGEFGGAALEDMFLNADNARFSDSSADLRALQRGLIRNGFRLLRPGGTLVYSTCSFSPLQNEEVVQWLLAEEPTAALEDLGEEPGPSVPSTLLPGALRFEPVASGTSGLFVARLRKGSVGAAATRP